MMELPLIQKRIFSEPCRFALMLLGIHIVIFGLLYPYSVSATPKHKSLAPVPIPELNADGSLGKQARALCEYSRKGYLSEGAEERIYGVPKYRIWIIVCADEPGWWESVWMTVEGEQEDRMERYVEIPLYGNIIQGLDIFSCAGWDITILEIRHTTHMGTRTRSIFSIDSQDDGLKLVREWQRHGKTYPPDDYMRCALD